jgi:hypothetical protein
MDAHQKLKHRRIMAIAEIIKKRQEDDYKRFLGEMQIHGLKKTVAEEYIEAMKDIGWIRLENDRIIWNRQNDSSVGRV